MGLLLCSNPKLRQSSYGICTVGEIQVQGVFGDSVSADIAPVDVKRCNDE